MRYYTEKPRRGKNKIQIPNTIFVIIAIIVAFNSFLYLFQKRILPTVLDIAEITMKAEAIKVINEETMRIYEENFNYDDIMKIEKDSEGNITMIRSDTIKQNKLTAEVVLACNEKLQNLGELGAKVPLGYMTNNAFFYRMGPKINVKMEQIGNLNTSYDSTFESAGINQVRHKIYLNIDVKMRLVVPLASKDVELSCEIPVSETIIVGKIPDTAINIGR